jgi:hypothetical protein
MAAATRKAARTKRRDANSGAVHTKGSRLIFYCEESFVSLVVFGVRRQSEAATALWLPGTKIQSGAALAAALQIFWLFIDPSRASPATNRPAHLAGHHFGLREHAQKILA